MKYKLATSKQFKKDLKLVIKRGYNTDLLDTVVTLLLNNELLPQKNKDHALHGSFEGYRECHILPDWLLIYKKSETRLILTLTATGTHSDLFK